MRIPKISNRVARWFKNFSGYFLIYVAVGGAVGFAFERLNTAGISCLPSDVEGMIGSHCQSDLINVIWFLLLGLPRVVLWIPAFGIARFKVAGLALYPTDAILNSGRWPLFLNLWIRNTTPLFLIIWQGFEFWKPRNRAIALLMSGAVIVEFLELGLEL